MEKEFIPYEQALALKELGFDEVCLGFYKSDKLEFQNFISQNKKRTNSWYTSLNGCTAPTFSQAFRFFREKYGLHYIICKNIQMDGYGYREVILSPYMEENENTIFKTYEEAELECLKKLIEIVKEK